jgi:hypothetical protein
MYEGPSGTITSGVLGLSPNSPVAFYFSTFDEYPGPSAYMSVESPPSPRRPRFAIHGKNMGRPRVSAQELTALSILYVAGIVGRERRGIRGFEWIGRALSSPKLRFTAEEKRGGGFCYPRRVLAFWTGPYPSHNSQECICMLQPETEKEKKFLSCLSRDEDAPLTIPWNPFFIPSRRWQKDFLTTKELPHLLSFGYNCSDLEVHNKSQNLLLCITMQNFELRRSTLYFS